MHLRREPVGQVARHRKPPRRIQQICDRLLYRGQLQPLDRPILIARDHALVLEAPTHHQPAHKRRRRRHPNRPIHRPLPGQQLARLVRDLRHLERRMKPEAHQLRIFRRRKAHLNIGRQVVRGRVQLGVDHIAPHRQRLPLHPLCAQRGGYHQNAGQGPAQRQHRLLTHRGNHRSHRSRPTLKKSQPPHTHTPTPTLTLTLTHSHSHSHTHPHIQPFPVSPLAFNSPSAISATRSIAPPPFPAPVFSSPRIRANSSIMD